jgi:hypothetical protein
VVIYSYFRHRRQVLIGTEVASHQAGTPSKRRRRNPDDDIEMEDKPNKFEKVGSGRGGFSVKGAAAAAARARWAKVRKERAERGDEDDGEPRKKGRVIRRENKAAVEKLKGKHELYLDHDHE